MFCDSDDWYEPDMCQIMYEKIEKQDVDVVCCHNFFEWQDNLNEFEKQERLVEKYYNPERYGKYSLVNKKILSTNTVLWNKIWRRDLVEKYYIRFPEVHEHDDDAFWYMYSVVSNKIFYLNKPLYHYFLRAGSIMSMQVSNHPKNRMDRIAISEYVLNFFIKNNIVQKKSLLMAKIFEQQLKCALIFFAPDEIKKICKKIEVILHNQLGLMDYRLVYSNQNDLLLFKNKNKLRLICKLEWYRLCLIFWGFLNSEYAKTRYRKYMDKVKRDQGRLECLKGENI